MIVLLVIGIVVAVMAVYAFWPRAGGIDGRVNRASAIAKGNAEKYDGMSGPNNGGGGGF